MKEVFDKSTLNEYEIGHLEYIVNSPSYETVFKPFIQNCIEMYKKLILEPNPARRQEWGGTTYLRCGANNFTKFLEFLDNILVETQHDRAIQARLEVPDEETYKQAAAMGLLPNPARGEIYKDEYPDDVEF